MPLNTGELSRWRQAATFDGFFSVEDWLGSLADVQCDRLGDALHHPALKWKRAHFLIKMPGEEEGTQVDVEVAGVAAGPFGIYKREPAARAYEFFLVHLPTGQYVLRLGRLKDCKALARDLAPLRMAWESTDPAQVTGPDEEKARAVLRRYNTAA